MKLTYHLRGFEYVEYLSNYLVKYLVAMLHVKPIEMHIQNIIGQNLLMEFGRNLKDTCFLS
jgi:hypothetical protein